MGCGLDTLRSVLGLGISGSRGGLAGPVGQSAGQSGDDGVDGVFMVVWRRGGIKTCNAHFTYLKHTI